MDAISTHFASWARLRIEVSNGLQAQEQRKVYRYHRAKWHFKAISKI